MENRIETVITLAGFYGDSMPVSARCFCVLVRIYCFLAVLIMAGEFRKAVGAGHLGVFCFLFDPVFGCWLIPFALQFVCYFLTRGRSQEQDYALGPSCATQSSLWVSVSVDLTCPCREWERVLCLQLADWLHVQIEMLDCDSEIAWVVALTCPCAACWNLGRWQRHTKCLTG